LRNKVSTLSSRPEKDRTITAEQLREKWDEEIRAMGYTKEGLISEFTKAQEKARAGKEQGTGEKLTAKDYVRMAKDDAAKPEERFAKNEILRKAALLSYRDGIGMDRLDKAFQELVQSGEIVIIDKHKSTQHEGSHRKYSTPEAIKKKEELLRFAREGKGQVKPIMAREEAEKYIEKYEIQKDKVLTTGQKDAAIAILTTTDRINLISGHAGSGKTYAMDAVNYAIEKKDAGITVRAMGFTGKAAAELESRIGISATTVDRALIDLKKDTITHNPKLWIIDEHSMLSSRKYHEIARLAILHNATIVSIGDLKQKSAIEAGKPVRDMQNHAGLKPTQMSEILRQEPAWYREITTELSKSENETGIDQQKVNRVDDFAFHKLHQLGKIQEVKNDAELKKETVKEYLKDYKGSLIVTATNNEKNEYNYMSREKLKAMGEIAKDGQKFTCFESKSLSNTDKRLGHNYEPGNYVNVDLGAKGMGVKSGVTAEITSRDLAKNTITISYENRYGDQRRTINLMRHGNNLSLYEKKNIEFAAGDKILFLKNSTESHKRCGINIKNGMTGIVKSIGGGRVAAQVGQREITWRLRDYSYISHGYAMTTDKAQGSTCGKVIMPSDTSKPGQHFKQFYTGITRGEKDCMIITTSKAELQEQVKKVYEKSSTLDYEKTKTQVERKIISQMQKDAYPGIAGKFLLAGDKLMDRIPVSKQFNRDIEKNHFSANKTIELMKKKEQALSAKDVTKTNQMTEKIKAEVSKMTPQEKAKYRQFASQLRPKEAKALGPEAQKSQLDKSKTGKSQGAEAGKNQKTETQKSQSTGLEK
jgi:ATP-dependent exoDNAse (exonuclease V) alpha subunit